jgi:glycerophosphoryl diester phosphodiesterase
VIIGCSHQRSDLHSALETMSKFCAYNTNAYVVRASVSMDENSDIGGASMIVNPRGEVLINMGSRVGMACAEIDPHDKYYKPAGFGNPLAAHYEYIEKGRRPWKYRPGGSAIVRHDEIMPYPRACAHRGFHGLLPENSLPAFGAAVAMGAPEIEFDIWYTKDGVPVSIHDHVLDRVSNGKGKIRDYTLNELRELDFGSVKSETLEGLKIPTLEEILAKLSSHTVMNIHLKTVGEKPEYLAEVIRLVRKYDCEKYVYFMLEPDIHIQQFREAAPHIPVCVGHLEARPWEIVDRAIALGAQKVQLFKPYLNQEMVDKAHENGIICNVFWSDDPAEAQEFLDTGIDVILTNDYNRIAQVVAKKEKYVTY